MNAFSSTKKQSAFTIVELLVVIVVIGILAGITIVSYAGISNRAVVVTLQSDLSNASTQFKIFQIENGVYPSSISTDCATTPTTATNLCLKPSPGNNFTTVAYKNPTPQSFILTEVNGNNTYHITESSAVTAGIYVVPTLAVTDPDNWLAIGTQVWARANLNVGTIVSSGTGQTNNGGTNIVEKYCFSGWESYCVTYGGLYQWDEAMKYVTTEKAQGICPDGSHIPSDNDWKILEIQLGMTQIQADAFDWRGTGQGTKIKPGGSSGLNIPSGGYRNTDSSIFGSGAYAYLWSSSESGTDALRRTLDSDVNTGINRTARTKFYGLSVRCIGN